MTGNVTLSAERCNVSRSWVALRRAEDAGFDEVGRHRTSAYAHRKRWAAFARRWDGAIETGYVRIEMALLSTACNLFSDIELPPEEVLRGMTVEQALQVLHMHKCEVRGIGGRPGRRARARIMEEVAGSIRRKVDIILRARGIEEL